MKISWLACYVSVYFFQPDLESFQVREVGEEYRKDRLESFLYGELCYLGGAGSFFFMRLQIFLLPQEELPSCADCFCELQNMENQRFVKGRFGAYRSTRKSIR